MDHELTAYLDRRFTENEHTTRRIVEETTSRIVEETTSRIVEEATTRIVEQTTQRIVDQATGRLGRELREELGGQIRLTHVLIEDLRSDLETVSEGLVARIDANQERNDQARREDRAFFTSLFQHSRGRIDDHETRLTRLESARA